MNSAVFVIFKDLDRTSPRREGFQMMEGARKLTGPAAVTKLGIPADLHSEQKSFLFRLSYYIHPFRPVNMNKFWSFACLNLDGFVKSPSGALRCNFVVAAYL
jgi:hypothetical protein